MFEKKDEGLGQYGTGPFSMEKEEGTMPQRPKIPCKHPGCSKLVSCGQRYCDEHAPLHQSDRRSSYRRGYDSRWQKASKRFLKTHPFCVRCRENGQFVRATVVDHIIPHRGDKTLFWDEKNWQPLCKSCHDHKTMTDDRNEQYKY